MMYTRAVLSHVVRLFYLSIFIGLVACGGGEVSEFSEEDQPSSTVIGIDENGNVIYSAPGTPPANAESLPRVNAGKRQFSDPNVILSLSGTAEANNNAAIVRSLWLQTGGPQVFLPQADRLTTDILIPDILEESLLVFQLVVEDSEGRFNSSTTSILVKPSPAFARVVGGIVDSTAEIVEFKVVLNAIQNTDTSINYTTTDGTALAGIDYESTAGTLVIPAGSTEATVPVNLLQGDVDEQNESFRLQISVLSSDGANASGSGVTLIRTDVSAIALPALEDAAATILTLNEPATISFINNGGGVSNCSATEPLPAGLDLSVESGETGTSCRIAGTPTEVSEPQLITLRGDNPAGFDTATITLSVEPGLPAPSLADIDFGSFVRDQELPLLTIINNGGGELTSCTPDGTALPAGISVAVSEDLSSCEITGTPSEESATTSYTVTAVNATGSSSATVTLSVETPVSEPILVAPSAQTFTAQLEITPLRFVNEGGGAISDCSLPAASLPAGLALRISDDGDSCEIFGTPTTVQEGSDIAVRATNMAGSSDTNVNISIATFIEPPLIEAVAPQSYTLRQTITPLRFTNSGAGELSSCTSDLPLPEGLAIAVSEDASTCIISGTPSTLSPTANYLIRVANRGGSDEVSLEITVNDIVFTESIVIPYLDSQRVRISMALISGTARIDWGDGSPTTDVTNQIINDGAGIRDHSYVERLAGNITIGFSDGLASLRAFADSAGTVFRTQMTLDDTLFAGMTNLEVLNINSRQNSLNGTFDALARNLPNLRELSINGRGDIAGDVADLPRSLTDFSISDASGSVGGSIADIPINMVNFSIVGRNTVSGDVGSLPASIENLTIRSGSNVINGSVGDLPNNLVRAVIQGRNEVSGNIQDLPDSLEFVEIYGLNTISGDIGRISDVSSALRLSVQGQNTISGDISLLPPRVTFIQVYNGSNTISGDIGGVHPAVTEIFITGQNTISGDLAQFQPNATTRIFLTGNNTVSGDIAGLSPNIGTLTITGSNTLSGNIESLNSVTTSIEIGGQNSVGGDINLIDLTNKSRLLIDGNNTITGDITNLVTSNTLVNFRVTGANTLSGDISQLASTSLVTIDIKGLNSITGNLNDTVFPAQLTNFTIEGNNQLSGEVGRIMIDRLRTFHIRGENTIGGNIQDMAPSTAIVDYRIVGQNTITGDIGLIPNNTIRFFEIGGNNTINTFTTNESSWSPTQLQVFSLIDGVGTAGFDTLTVDEILIYLNATITVSTAGFTARIELTRIDDQPRSSASDDAVANLTRRRYEVNTNTFDED